MYIWPNQKCRSEKQQSYSADCFATSFKSTLRIFLFLKEFYKNLQNNPQNNLAIFHFGTWQFCCAYGHKFLLKTKKKAISKLKDSLVFNKQAAPSCLFIRYLGVATYQSYLSRLLFKENLSMNMIRYLHIIIVLFSYFIVPEITASGVACRNKCSYRNVTYSCLSHSSNSDSPLSRIQVT